MRLIGLIAALLVLVSAQNVDINLQADFNVAPLLFEASEYFADVSTTSYFAFLRHLTQHSDTLGTTERSHASFAFDYLQHQTSTAQPLLDGQQENSASDSIQLAALQTSLSLSLNSPRIATFQSLFESHINDAKLSVSPDCVSPLIVDVAVFCSLQSYQQHQLQTEQSHMPTVYAFDHIRSTNSLAPLVIHYVDLEQPASFAELMSVLLQQADKGDVQYVVRPKVSAGRVHTSFSLQAFGAELALKNTEYKVLNDEPTASSTTESSAPSTTPTSNAHTMDTVFFGQSLNQSAWKSRHQAAQQSVRAVLQKQKVRAMPTKNDDEEKEEYSKMALRVTQTLVASSDPLSAAQTLALNFPSFANAFRSMPVNHSLLEDVRQNARMFGTDGHNYLSLNGIEFNVDEFTAFDVAQVLRSESQLIQRFSSMGLPASVIQSMLNIAFPASTSGSETVKMDLRSKNEAVFLNNLEKDRQYKQWSSTVQELLTPGWPNQLKYVAKNLYQVLIVGRAADVMTLHMAAAAQYFVKNNAPFRVGLILTDSIETNSNTVVDKTNSDVWPEDVWPRASWSDLAPVKGVDSASTSTTSTSSTQSVSVDALLSKCFRYLAEVHSPISAFNFIDYFKSEHVAAKLTSQTVQSNFVSAFSRAPAKKASLYFLEGDGAAVFVQLSKPTDLKLNTLLDQSKDFVRSRGLEHCVASQPCVFLNGQHAKMSSSNEFQQAVSQILFAEQRKMQMKAYYRQLTDQSNTDDIAYADALPRVNPYLFGSHSESESDSSSPYHILSSAFQADSSLLRLRYIAHADGDSDTKCATMLLVTNLGSPGGIAMASALIDFVQQAPSAMIELSGVQITPFARFTLLHDSALVSTYTAAYSTDIQQMLGRFVTVCFSAHSDNAQFSLPLRSRIIKLLKSVVVLSQSLAAKSSDSLTLARVSEALRSLVMSQIKATAAAQLFLDAIELNGRFAADVLDTDQRLVLNALRVASGNNDASLLVLNGRFYTFPVTILGNAAQDALTIDDIAILMHTECSSRSGKVIIALQQTPMSAAASLVEQPTESVLIRLGLTSSDVQSHIVLLSTWLLAARSDAGLIAQKSSVQTVLGPGRTPLAPTDSSLNQAGHIRQHMHSRHLLYSFDASTGFNGIGATPSSTALLNVLAVVNPLSNGGQRMLGLLMSLRDLFSVRSAPFQMQVLFAPSESIPSDQFSALKRYYRYVFSPALVFDPQSGRRTHSEHRASFKHVPTAPIYTLQLETPESWLIESIDAVHDLDNLKLSDSNGADGPDGNSVHATYALRHLLISGQCFEKQAKKGASELAPAAGLQLITGRNREYEHDTVVMANLGYFQLKAAPGVWGIQFAPGKHASTYAWNGFSETQQQNNILSVPVTSFQSDFVRLSVKRRPGQENVRLDADGEQDEDAEGVWNSVSKMFSTTQTAPVSANETIHVFSIASGHLYERFLKIMMLSVIKSTQNPVKFWFVANFLSPQFKQFAPKMAQEYNFQVEFVTYRWPNWLRRQKEKQRVIWGYKILFLDVLFPLRVSKIIFIDADQIVRGNLKELVDMDLQGAPYAYTPFCDSNKAVDGFRFWNQGFWKDHLRGKPYHISALYVVDLDKFRKMKAGDSLRAIYDQLSADPNSLANLDQDLPNYTQHMVPIFSLPQQWLFCATWCSLDDLPKAKTIDLCNNPMTKEPKIEAAKRIVSEWVGLDQEAREIGERHVEHEASQPSARKAHDEL